MIFQTFNMLRSFAAAIPGLYQNEILPIANDIINGIINPLILSSDFNLASFIMIIQLSL